VFSVQAVSLQVSRDVAVESNWPSGLSESCRQQQQQQQEQACCGDMDNNKMTSDGAPETNELLNVKHDGKLEERKHIPAGKARNFSLALDVFRHVRPLSCPGRSQEGGRATGGTGGHAPPPIHHPQKF